MFRFYDCDQNSDEWFDLRAGKLTSSNLPKIMANYGKAFGEPAKKYAVNIAIEQITGQPLQSTYSNHHMERGHEQEPLARRIYEDETFCDVDNGGFFDCGFVGCSPDGLVGDNGLIEIKSVIAPVHFASIKRQAVDPAYYWQCVGNLMLTERKWIDFISYCADFPIDNQIFTHRLYASDLDLDFAKVKSRISEFEKLVINTKNIITKGSICHSTAQNTAIA